MIKFLKNFVIITCIIAISSTLTGCRFVDKKTREAMQPVTLTYWRVFDGQEAFEDLFLEFNRFHPHISISYRKLTFEEYEEELLDALAEDRGPDIFSIHNTWMTKYRSKLLPMPDTITLPYQITKGTIKKEKIVQLRTDSTISIPELQEKYVPVVAKDVVMKTIPDPGSKQGSQTRVFGLPLNLDTLVLYYNRDILNNAGVVTAPRTWKQFQDAVKAITKIDQDSNLVQSAAGFGTAENVSRYFDIISLLMIQSGTQMVDDKGRIVFDKMPAGLEREELPAVNALRFYTDFARPNIEVYTWDYSRENSFDEFLEGNLAFFFGYGYHLPIIQTQGPALNFGISTMPQLNEQDPIHYANYWIEVVSNKTEYSDEAWEFVQFITNPENVKPYLDYTQKVTATNALVESQVDDLSLGVFAEQVQTAQSWYDGYNTNATEKIFAEMIDQVIKEENLDYESIIQTTAQKAAQTLQE